MGLFSRRSALSRTGNPEDDELYALIAQRSDIRAPRHWMHYLYFADEKGARAACAAAVDHGWTLQRVGAPAPGEEWIVIAERRDTIVTPEAIRDARAFFGALAASIRGGEYDGWEASL
jgi:hypothetical protein